jgi:hypothetical protein
VCPQMQRPALPFPAPFYISSLGGGSFISASIVADSGGGNNGTSSPPPSHRRSGIFHLAIFVNVSGVISEVALANDTALP